MGCWRANRLTEIRPTFTDGAAYERLVGQWSARVGEVFLDWLAVPKDLSWIDVGCGNGSLTEQIATRRAPMRINGIDPSEAQLAYAKKRPGVGPTRFQVGDAMALPFPDASFDAAVMGLVITFVPEPAKAVAEMKRVVRPGGYVATYMWDIFGGGLPVQPLWEAMRKLELPTPELVAVDASKLDVMKALWAEAGLDAVETRVITITVTYATFEDYWSANTAPSGPTAKAINDLTPTQREHIERHLREHLPRDAQGRPSFPAHANAVKGRVR
jgi:ubiquinone/menaquinone biosynthesis C-methylase UbiE